MPRAPPVTRATRPATPGIAAPPATHGGVDAPGHASGLPGALLQHGVVVRGPGDVEKLHELVEHPALQVRRQAVDPLQIVFEQEKLGLARIATSLFCAL